MGFSLGIEIGVRRESEDRAPTSGALPTEGTRMSANRQPPAAPRVPGRRPKRNQFGKTKIKVSLSD